MRATPRDSLFLHAGRASRRAALSTTAIRFEDPRLKEFGKVIEDDFASLRDNYSLILALIDYCTNTDGFPEAPKHPIILAHGLFGFEELHIAGPVLPGLHYWRGITEALAKKNVEVITAAVPPSGSIEARAEKLAEVIETKAKGKSVNIIAYVRSALLENTKANMKADIAW